MKYDSKALMRAQAEIDERRAAVKAQREDRIKEIESKFPEIARVNTILSGTVKEIAQAMTESNIGEIMGRIADKNLEAQKTRRQLLVSFGYPEDYLDIHYKCEKCGDTGFVNGSRCTCLETLARKYSIEQLHKDCHIALNDFSRFDLNVYPEENRQEMKAILDMCVNYAETFSTQSDMMFFFGGTGLGKTLLSSAIAKRVLERGFSVAYDSLSNFLRKIEQEHYGRSEGDTVEMLLSADLVILDDMGSEFRSGFNDAQIYDIINSRINYRLPTIVSTNLSHNELNARYNERIVSRLLGMFIPVKFNGRDVRLKKRMSQ